MGFSFRNGTRSFYLHIQVCSLVILFLATIGSYSNEIYKENRYLGIFLAHLNLMFVLRCSGRLIRTFADVKYGNYHLTTVEIIYNIISFIIAIVTTVAFTIYAKRALKELERAEATEEVPPSHQESHEMGKLPLERPKRAGLSSLSL